MCHLDRILRIRGIARKSLRQLMQRVLVGASSSSVGSVLMLQPRIAGVLPF